MNPLAAIALVCAASMPQSECDKHTALDAIQTHADSLQACIMGAQASGAHAQLVQPETYLKIICERRFEATAQ